MKQTNYDTMKNLYDNGYRTVDMCKIFASLIVTSSRTTCSASEVFLDLFTNNGEKTLKELNENHYSNVKSITSHLPIDAEVASELLLKAEDIDVEIDPTPIRQFTIRRRMKEETAIAYTFEYTSNDGCWCSRNRPSRAVVIIEGTNLSMIKVKGVDPTFWQAFTMVFESITRSASIHGYTRDSRVYPYRINVRIGYSDCEDYFLDLYCRRGSKFFRKCNAETLHISMANKVSDITDMYVGDAVELFLAAACADYREACDYKDIDFNYNKNKKLLRRHGVKFVRPYKNEVFVDEEEMDFIPRR